MLCTQWHQATTRNSKMIPQPTPHGPPWPPEDLGTATTWLLVAWDAHICEEFCRQMCCLSAGKDKLALDRPTSDAYQGSTTGQPFAQISYNFITDLLVSNGFDSLMAVVDHGLLKGVILCPCHKTIDATGTAELLIQNVYRRFGLPDKGISDKGPQFASKVFREMGHLLGIELAMSTIYHPQTDGATEWENQEIEAYLAIFCANNPEQWSRLIPIMEFSYNQKSHATQTKSPFYLIIGSDPKAIFTTFLSTNVPEVKEQIWNLQKARDKVIAAHELARWKMMKQTTHKFKLFQKDDSVWLESKNLKLQYESKKDPSISLKYSDPSHTNWNFQNNGRSIPCSMPHFSPLSKRMIPMDPITSTHHQTLLMENLSMK